MKKIFIISILAIGCVNNLYAVESCGIDKLDTSIKGIEFGYARLNGNAGSKESNYGLTTGSGQWATEFSYGTVWGMAKCSETSGNSSSSTWPESSKSDWLKTPSDTTGGNCWCQVTGFSPSDSDYTQGPQCTTSASNMWVFYFSYKDAATCAYACAFCGGASTTASQLRKALLDAVPRTFSLNWYDGDTPFSGGASSCTLGGTFTPPSTTPPAREGYIFTGWRVLTCADKINRLDYSIFSTYFGYTCLNGDAGVRESNYGLTPGSGEWASAFSYGTVWGKANCNNTNGTPNTVGTPTLASSGKYCWCQVIGFSPSGSDYTQGPQCRTNTSNKWVFEGNESSANECASGCVEYCKNLLCLNKAFRTAAYGAVAQ